MSTPPPLPQRPQSRAGQPPSRAGRATCLGCGAAFIIGSVIVAIVLVILVQNFSTFFSSATLNDDRNSVVGSAYVGEWLDTANPNSFIQILPNGSANCQVTHGVTHFSVNGGHATFDKNTGRLSIKFFFFGPSWHVDEAPHPTADGLQMKLDGSTFRRLRAFPSPSKSPGSGLSV